MSQNRILIGLSTGETIRRAACMSSFLAMQKPEGTILTTIHGQSPAQARNIIIKQAIENKATHIFFADDDMLFPPNILPALLEHDKDVVTGLYLMRDFPHIPCIFDYAQEDGWCQFKFLRDDVKPELTEIVNCGFGCVLIKMSVIEALDEYEPYWVTLGEITPDGWCDDVAFFNKVRKAGFKIYCDMSIAVGHASTVTLFPRYIQETSKWATEYNHATGTCMIPAHVPVAVAVENNIEKNVETNVVAEATK